MEQSRILSQTWATLGECSDCTRTLPATSSVTNFCSFTTPGRSHGFPPSGPEVSAGELGMVAIRSETCVFSVMGARRWTYPRVLMDGVYDEMALLNAFSIEPGECTPAARHGIELSRP